MIRLLLLGLLLVGCASPTEPEPCPVATVPFVDAQGDTVSIVRTEFCWVAVGAVP